MIDRRSSLLFLRKCCLLSFHAGGEYRLYDAVQQAEAHGHWTSFLFCAVGIF